MDFTNISKNTIMLKEENKRFAFERDKEIRGYIKLETDGDKGLMVVTVENVKFFPRGEYSYKLILTGVKKEKRHYHMVGNISVGLRQGGGELPHKSERSGWPGAQPAGFFHGNHSRHVDGEPS